MNKYVIDNKCYNPFHYAIDFETCSCGLKIGTDIIERRNAWMAALKERSIAETERIQATCHERGNVTGEMP